MGKRINTDVLTGKQIAITGGTGFIGSNLITKLLLQKPGAIRIISSGSKTDRIKPYLPNLDITVYHNVREYTEQIISFKPDYLFILGGNSDPRLSVAKPRMDLECNLLYNFTLLEKISRKRHKPKILYVSSVAVYGDNASPLIEDLSATTPKSPYGINKLAMEGYVRFFAECRELPAFSVRLSATYGPGLKKQVVYDFIQKLLQDPKKLAILGDGTEIRDLCYIDDQVDGLLFLAKKAHYQGEVYNLGSGQGISIAELASKISKIMNLKPKIVYEKHKHEKHHGQTWILDNNKARTIGHSPKIGIDEGLKKTIEWVTQQ